MIDLQAIFGGGPAVPVAVAAMVSCPDDDGGRFVDWVRRPDAYGCMGWQAPDLPEAMSFDDLDLPGPACPRCGSLVQWQDLLGRQRCGVCEADALGRALKLAERAARLRTQAQPRKPAPGIAPCCVANGSVDTLDLGDKRPTQGRLRGLCGV
jgi:ribosomal protein S27AE